MNHIHALTAFAGIAVFGIGIGLGLVVYCVSYLLARHRADSGPQARGSRARCRAWLRRCAVLIVWSSIATAVVAIALEVAQENAGLLEVKGAFTLRAREGLEVESVTAESSIEAGDFLASFRSPKLEAEAQALRRRQRALEESKRVLSATPLEIDPKLARQEQRLDDERRHHLAAFERLTMEKGQVRREHSKDRVEKTREITIIDRTLGKLEGELDQARSYLAKETRELRSSRALYQKRVISEDSHEGHREDVDLAQAEVDKIERQDTAASEERAKLHQGSKDLAELAREQTEALNSEIEKTRRKLATVANEHASLENALAVDRIAAHERRKDQLLKIDYEIAEYEATVLGIERTLKIEAPIAGSIGYRNAAPNTVLPGDPLLVLAPPEAFVLRLRLPIAEAAALAEAGPVASELKRRDHKGTGQARSAPPEHLVRRFPTKLREWHPLEHEPGMALAEMTASPPAEAMRELASGEPVEASLQWMPPLFALPLFLLAVGAGATGILGAVFFRTAASAAKRETQESGAAYPAGGIFQLDRDDNALRLLGAQLRDTLWQGEIDQTLVATIEWTIDRRGVDAVRLLAEGIGNPRDLKKHLDRVIRAHTRTGSRPQVSQEDGHDGSPDQLIRILRTIAPRAVSSSPQSIALVTDTNSSEAEETLQGNLHSGTDR